VEKSITIGICFTEANFSNYPEWIQAAQENIEIVILSREKQNKEDLLKCHGLVLTGGVDTDPFFYEPSLAKYPNMPIAWNRQRDQFEIDLFTSALALTMPVLGICRGLQLVNTALGGTMLPDIEAAGKQNHRAMAGKDFVHAVQVVSNSLLNELSKQTEGIVNSAHHQAIGKLAEPLLANCFAEEEITEGIEWKNKKDRSPMLCVQWHPERIANKETNPLSKNIREWFLMEAAKYSV